MIASALAFLASPLGKLAGYAAAAIAVVALCLILLAAHDSKIRAADALAVQQKTSQALVDAANRATQVALSERDAAVAAAAEAATIKGNIHRAPASSTCINSDGARAMLDGLQPGRAGAGQAQHTR